jgi:hypothetical protein
MAQCDVKPVYIKQSACLSLLVQAVKVRWAKKTFITPLQGMHLNMCNFVTDIVFFFYVFIFFILSFVFFNMRTCLYKYVMNMTERGRVLWDKDLILLLMYT